MVTTAEVEQALEAAGALPHGLDRVLATEHAVGLADELNDHWWQTEARVQLATAYTYGDTGPHEFTVQAWLLAALDAGEPALSPSHRHHVLWHCKWMMERALETSTIPLSVMRRTFDDVERRYRTEGESEQPAAKYQLLLALETADASEVKRWMTLWRTSTRSAMSDCLACDALDDARLLADEGDVAAALARVTPTLERQIGCLEEPHSSLSWSLDWRARLGLFADAEQAHLQSWRMVQGRADNAELAVRHLVFLVRSGRVDRALELLLPRLAWVEQTRLDRPRMELAAAGAMILRAAAEVGLAPAALATGESVDEAATRLEAVASGIAAAFDERNGTDVVSRRLAAQVVGTPYDLDAAPASFLLGVSSSVRTPARTASAQAPSAAQMPDVSTKGSRPGAGLEAELPRDVSGYAKAVREAVDAMHGNVEFERLLGGWLDDRKTLPPADTPQEHADRSRLDRMALQHSSVDDAMVDRLLEDARAHAEASNDRVILARVLIQAEQVLAGRGDDTARARAVELVLDLETTGDWEQVGSAWLSLAHSGDHALDLEAAERAASAFARADDQPWRGVALQSAGFSAVFVDRGRAEGLLEDARGIATALQLPALGLGAVETLARLAWQSGDLPRAADFLREGIGYAADLGEGALHLREALADVLVDTADWGALLPCAQDELVAATRRDEPLALARAQRHVGLALHELGRSAEAAEILETARSVLAREADPSLAPCCWALGGSLSALGEHSAAATSFVEAGEAFGEDRASEAAHAFSRAGRALVAADTATDAATALQILDRAADLARRSGNAGLFASIRQTRADAIDTVEGVDDALVYLDATVDATAEVQEEDGSGDQPRVDLEYLRAMTLRQGGRLLAARGRMDGALLRLRASAEVLEEAGEDAALVVRFEEAQMLLDIGQTEAGEDRLRPLLEQLDTAGYHDQCRRAAGVLCTHLDQTGRGVEADQLWARWGQSGSES